VDVAQLVHAVIVQLSGVAASRSCGISTCVKVALHIVNIDFELNLSNFCINFYYYCRQLNNMH